MSTISITIISIWIVEQLQQCKQVLKSKIYCGAFSVSSRIEEVSGNSVGPSSGVMKQKDRGNERGQVQGFRLTQHWFEYFIQ
jgi:hypothetical protein